MTGRERIADHVAERVGWLRVMCELGDYGDQLDALGALLDGLEELVDDMRDGNSDEP